MLLSIGTMLVITGFLGFLYGKSVMRLELVSVLIPPAIVFGSLIARSQLLNEPFSPELLGAALFGCLIGTALGIIFRLYRPYEYRIE